MLKRYTIIGLLTFILFAATNTVFAVKQKVYFVENLGLFQKIKREAKEHNLSSNEVISKYSLPLIDREFARRHFNNLNWLDCNTRGDVPTLLVVNMGPEVGHGLFALDEISEEV